MKTTALYKYIAFTAIISLFGTLLLSACNSPDKVYLSENKHVVSSGETLWSICTEYKPDGMDMREYVYLCREASEIGDVIYPGDVVTVFTEVGK